MLQQENKTDYNSLIGFALIGIVLFWFLNEQAKVEEVMLQKSSSSNKRRNDFECKDVSYVSAQNDHLLFLLILKKHMGFLSCK